jgi:hypothetical protein
VKKKRLHSCNVLDSSPAERHLWHFTVERDDAKLQREETIGHGTPVPAKLAQKDWHDLYQPKLNIAWVPASRVFLRVVQLPAVDRQELQSMLEFQLERLSPLPVPQILWSFEVLPSRAENMQTAVVCIVSRDAVEEFISQVEAQSFQPDRLEIPQLNQIISDGAREDGGWIYANNSIDPDLCTVAWWSGGTLQDLQLLRLPAVSATEAGGAAAIQNARAEFLREQLMQTAWAGEMEGWLTLPVKWRLIADENTISFWLPLITPWAEDGVETHPAFDSKSVAHYSAARAARGEPAADLLPPEFSTRYHQQYVDRLWMRGLGALVGLYVIGVAIFLVTLQVYSFQDNRLKAQVAGISNTYTNVLQLKERVEVLQEQLNLQYAALDSLKIAAEQLPEDFTLVNLVFSGGRSVNIYGTAPVGEESKIIGYNEAIRKATVNGQLLYKDVMPPNITRRPGADTLSWNFDCLLNVSDTL